MTTSVSKEFAQDSLDTLFGTVYTGDLTIALLKSAATSTDGTLSITGAQLTAASDGYAPVAYAIADLNPATGNNPAYRDNSTEILFDYNTGVSNWETITGVAILSGSTVLQVVSADSPVTIAPGRRVRIAAGALQLRTDSV